MVPRRGQLSLSGFRTLSLAVIQVPLVQTSVSVRWMSTKRSPKMNSLSKSQESEVDYKGLLRNGKADFSPLPVLSKSDIAKITTTDIGSKNLNISERDLLEIDSFSSQLFDMLDTPFSEDTLLDIKELNVDKLFSKVKDTLHVDDLPATIKAMRVLSAQNRVDDALFLWKVLQQDPKQCTLFAWTAYFSILCNHGKAELAKETIKDMVLSGVKPDEYIYGSVVHGLVKEGKLDEAYGVSREMMKTGMRPNNVIFSSLICGCIQRHQLSRANETFDLMRNYIEEPDVITLSLMIKVSEMQHNTERAISLFDSISLHNQTPTAGCYLAIMHACASSWRYDVMAFDYFQKMIMAGFSPSLQAYHILLEACTRHGDFVRANHVLMELQNQGYQPTPQTMTLMLRVLAASIDGDLALPEHPAGNRRFTRKEYDEWKQGVPIAKKKDRLDYVRELRTREIDDGLGVIPTDETDPEMEQEAPEHAEQAEHPLVSPEAGATSIGKGLINEDLTRKITTMKVTGSGRTRGLTEKELTGNPKEKPEEMLPMDIRTAVEQVVSERYSSELMMRDAEKGVLQRAADQTLSNERDPGSVPRSVLDSLEKTTRTQIETLYRERGGDVGHIDYSSSLWQECVNETLRDNTPLMRDMKALVRQKFGLTSLMGMELIERKEKADQEFQKEIQFLRQCFQGGDHSHYLTQLRLAKEIDESVLKQYELLQKVEPSMVYRRHTNFTQLTVPNQMRDLNEYWERLYNRDSAVPALKSWVIQEGETLWKRVLEMTENKPKIVDLNSYLAVYTNSRYLNRSRTIFDSFEKYEQQPDAYSYHLMVRMYAKAKRMSEAALLLKDMQTKGMTPAPETYGEMLIGLARVNDVNRALVLMTFIKQHNLPIPKERYLRPLRMRLNALGMRDHPSMPEDKEATWRKGYRESVRKNGKKGNYRVQHLANL